MTISEVKGQARLLEWHRRIQEQKSSGQTIRGWCGQRGCREGQFYYWLRLVRNETITRYESERQGQSLVRIDPAQLPSGQRDMPPAVASQPPGIVIRYGNSTVELPAGMQTGAIAELLKALSDP